MSTSDSEPHSLTGDASHLSSTFKRPFDQLDVGENIEGETPSSSAAGNDRHKRARSESRSEVTSGSGAVPSNVGGIDPDHLSATLEQLAALPGPSRIDRSSNAQRGDEFPNQYELSMERFNNFEEQIQPLREASPILERRSPSSSENPHDEDEIMEQLFAEPARSSQSWRADHAPPPIITEPPYVSYAPPYPPHTEDVIDIIGRRNSEPSERDVVVISDSDDEVEIVDRSNQAHSTIAQDSVSVSDVPSVDPLDLWDGLTTVFNPWADSLAGQTSTPVAHTSPSPTTSSRNRSQPSPSGSSAERRARLPSIHETGRSLRPSPAWSPSPSSRTPAASTSLAVEEQGMARLRGLAELRRRMDEERLESLQRGADVRAVLRRIRDASDRARPPLRFGAAQSNTHDDSLRPVPSTPFVYEGEGTRIDNPFPRSSLSASTGRLGSARTATDTADSRLNELFSSVGRLATPVVTSQTAGRSSQGSENTSVESDQRRHSLVMEGLLNSNPALVSGWRPVPRRAAQPEGSQPSPSSTSQSTTSQNTYYNSRPAVSRSSPSRPPSWLTSTSPSASSDPRNQAIPPSSTDDSIASFVTADTSFEDNISVEQAASTAAAHAPAVSSPLREVYIVPSPTPPSQDPLTQSSVLRDDASVDGVNMRDITSRVQSLSGLLMNMATSTHASAAVRDAALRVITSGQALVRAIDSDGRYNDGQMGNDTSTITVDIGDGNIQSFATRDHQARSSSSATINSTSQIPQQSSSFESWTPHDRSGIEDIISRPLHDPPRNDIVRNSLPPSSLSSSEGSGNRGYHVAPPLIDPARSSRLDTGVDNDRWTQARHHRRRLQNDLLAEESRMRSLRRLSETYAPELSRRSRRPEVDSSRMDVDSEDEVEVLFNSGAFDGQDSMEVDPEANPPVPRRTPVPPPPSRSANNTASRTVLRPSTVQRRAPPVVLAEGSTNPPRPAVPTAPHRVIDLDAYHDGPFRGALARAVEASRQTEQRRQQQRNQAAPTGEGAMRRITFHHIPPSPANRSNLPRDQPSGAQPSPAPTVTLAPAAPVAQPVRRTDTWYDDNEYERLEDVLDMYAIGDGLTRLNRSRQPERASSTRRSGEARSAAGQPAHRRYDASRQAVSGAGVGSGTGGRRYIPAFLDLLDIPEDPISFGLGLPSGSRRRGVSQSVIDSLQRGTYGEWANADTEKQCPICFEDFEASDAVLRLPKCKHWFHKPCIEEWFKSSATCPICRDRVGDSSHSSSSSRNRPRRIPPLEPSLSRFPPLNRATVTQRVGSMTPRRNESSIHILPPSSSTTEWSRSTAWRRLPTELLSDAHRTTLLNRNINLRSENTSDNTRSTRDSAAPTPGPRTSTPTATSGGNDNGQRHRVQAAQEGQRGSNTSRRSQALPPPIPEFVFEDEDASDGDIWGYLN